MDTIDPRAFEFALSQIDNGFIFEEFASAFLASILGYEFVPAGGIKDRGIDGLEHIFQRNGNDRFIYQSSIDSTPLTKLQHSLQTLQHNKIRYNQFFYVTNQVVREQDKIIDALYDQYKKQVRIFDSKWFVANVNNSEGAINAYKIYILNNMHEFQRPGTSYVLTDLVKDPRLFVFLRQQWDQDEQRHKLDVLLADTLILFVLEGTDPEKKIFKSSSVIKADIASLIAFNPKTLHDTIDKRLKVLSQKPRRIHYHPTSDGYCLPYETRLQIQERNLLDADLFIRFREEAKLLLTRQLANVGVRTNDVLGLMETALNLIFYQQGLEFADFVLKGENADYFEKELENTLSAAVAKSNIIPKNREAVKSGLIIAIRNMVYRGTATQKEYLQKLSNTYMLLFLLQCDPKIATFFSSMAAKLNIYVCTSLIIPAMSEFLLPVHNRRHCNLLKGARDAGVKLIINETILGELVSHFQMIVKRYDEVYRDVESVYLSDEMSMLYIDEIMIRAYFYAKLRKEIDNFENFIDNYVNPRLENPKEELRAWLDEEYGIEFRSDASLDIKLDKHAEQVLFNELKSQKSAPEKARNDARLLLTIQAIRDKHNEVGEKSILGYHTWWLSKDTTTQRAANKVLRDKIPVSCYMRPDFLYNYICLAPKSAEVRNAYDKMFPSLIGVNISFHLPFEVVQYVHEAILVHKEKNHARLGAVLRTMIEKLKSDPSCRTRAYVKHYLDEVLKDQTEAKSNHVAGKR